MAENKKFSVRTDGKGQNVFVSDVFLLSVPEEERTKVLSINDDGRVVLTSASGSGGGGVTSIIAGTNITISPIGGTGAVTINASGGGGGDVTEVTSATTNQITVANSTGPNPAISAVTAAISNGGTGLATADQIHTFVTTQTDEIDSDTSGNAATATLAADATTLATPRAINGVNFDGSAAITVPAAGSTLTDTVTVAKGGTNATSFADKSVIITQDSGTDTLAAVAMSTNGQLLIGGTSGPAVATLTAGAGISVINSNGGVTVLAHLGVGTTITADKNTTNIDKGYFYPMDSSGGPITFTLDSSGGAEIGDEWEFFVLDLSNDITFTATLGESIISEGSRKKANAVGSGIIAKFLGNIGGTNTWALVGSLKS